MNEEALQQLYTLAQGEGYSKSFDDFKVLMSSNEDALNNMYTVAQGEGYKKSMDDFKVLVGFGGQAEISQEVKDEFAKDPVREALKKKDVTESVSADGSLESQISDEQAQFMQNLSGSGFETMSTEEIKQSFTPVTGPTDFDVEENPDRYKIVKVEQATEENPFALGNDIIDLEDENLQVRQENLERYKRKLEQDIEAMVPEQNTPTPQPKIVGYDKFSNTPIYDYSEAFADFDKQAKLVSAEVDSQPIREEIDDLNLRILETKIPGFKKQPSFKEIYESAYDPKTRKFNKEKLAEIDSDLPLLTNDFFEDLMASPGAARTIYNAHVENYYNDKKRAAGYINVGGELVDPLTPLPKGYGFDAAIDSFGSFAHIVSKEEEEAVGRLNNMFNQYGFTFEQTGGGDRLLGFGPDGKQLKFFGEDELPLDNWTDATDKKYGAELKRVLVNAYEDADFTDEEMLKQALLRPSSRQADVVGAQPSIIAASGSWTKRAIGQIEKDNKVLNDLAVLMNSQNILAENAMKKADALKDKEFKNGLWTSYEAQEEYNTLIKEVNDIAQVYEGTYNAALKMDTDLKANVNQIKKFEGDRAMMMANMWDLNNVPALILQSIGKGAGGVLSGFYGLADDAFSNMINLASGYDETSTGYQTDEARRERKASVSKQFREGGASLFTLDMLPGVDGKTSAETIAAIQSQPLLSGAGTLGVFMGVAESLPAIFSGAPVMSFAAMHMDGMAREMDNIPEFKNISENEKMLVLAPIATVAGVLENFGLRNALSSSSLTARITIGALKKFGAQTAKEGTKRTFREIVERSVMNKFAKGGILLASSAAAEAETGAAQEMAETYMKEIYDLVKGQDFYKQSIDLSKGEIMNMEFAKEIVKAGYAEAIGGLVLGAPAAYSAAVGNNTIPEISDAAFNLFTMTTTPESVERTLEVQRAVYQTKVGVETNPETGQKYTQKEIDDILLQYEYLLGQKNEINPNWDASYQKQVLALLMQKKNLEQSIEGLNKDTTKDQQRQIEILKEDIEIISSEANKKYEEVLKKEYEKAKKEGFTGTIEAFKFRQSVEKAAEERGKQAPVKKEAPVVEETMSKEEIDELWSKESSDSRIELEIEAEEQLEKEDSQRRAMLRNMGRRTEKKLITSEEIKQRAKELLVKKIKEDSSKKKAPVVEQATAQQEVLETEPITKITNDLVAKEKKGELTQQETDGILLGIMEKIEAENAKRKTPLSPEQAQKKLGKMQQRVFEANKDRYLELSGVMPAAQEQVVEQVSEEVVEKTPPMVEKAPVKEAPKRKRRRKKVAPAVKEEVKVSEEVTTPIAKPKVVVSGTSDGYQVVSSANTTQAENESIKDARGDKTFDKDGFRITKLEDGSSQVSYKSKVRVSDKGNRPGYAMATVIIPEGSPVNKQQIQEAFDNKLSEIIESNRKKKLGAKFSELTTEQNQQLTDAVVNAISQEQAVEKAPVKKEAPKKKAPVKEQAQVSEEVQKEIDRAERLRDRVVAEKANKLSKTKGFEQKEEIRAEIRQAEKKYNNIITELKEGKRTQFQVKETQETKTDTSRYQQFISVLKRSFPSVEVVTTQAEFDALLEETGAIELTTKDQSVYGAVYQGKLYLNPSLANYNTPIHEFGHVWMNVAKEANPELYEKGISLVKGSKYEQQVRNNPAYKDSTEQEILEEALATAIGDKGESFVKESQKKNFKDWLNTLYKFVRKLTGISKYTAKQLEDITLDEFTQAVAVDLLSGKQLFEGAEITDMGDALQLMAEKGVDLDAAMNEAINDMIDKGFKAAEIKGVLLQMGYKARAINDALVVNIDADMKLPNEFANIEGGVKEGETMFRSVMEKLKEFAAPKLVKRSMKEQYNEAKKDGYEGTLKEYTEEQNNKKVEMLKQANPALAVLTNEEILKRYPNIQNEVVEKQQKSRAEIRAKAIKLLEAEAAFQAQDNLTKLELINSMDRTMKTRSNKQVQKRINAIKQTLKGVREGVKDLQAAKKRIKNFINEELLPIGLSVREASKLVRIVEKATKETYESSVAEVMKVVEAQTSKKKQETIDKMLKLAQQKSKGKKGAARTSPEAARFFKQAAVILKALSKNDTNKLEALEEQLREQEAKINEIIDKINDGIEVDDKQQELVALAQAFDILGSLNKQDLSETQDAFNLMKSELESGMESLRTRRAARKAIYDRIREEANESIREGYGFLFDENGKPLSDTEIDSRRKEIWNEVTGIKSLVKAVGEFYNISFKPKMNFFADYLKHLGTLTNGLDRKGDFFKKNIYDKLNNMEESYLQGYFNTIDLLSSELEAIGIEGGYDGLSKIINDGLIRNENTRIEGIKLDLKGTPKNISLSKAEAMRIYALSKNADQRARLKEQGFTDAKMQQIEEFLGEQLVQAADKVVDILSTSYYESVNKVYEDVNDVSLPFIENYFPTKKAASETTKSELEQLRSDISSGNFAGVFSAQQASALKERTSKDAIDIVGQDFSSVLEEHIRSMERFKAYAMGTKEINIVINHTGSVRALLKATNLKSTISDGIMYAINPNAMQQYFELKNRWFTRLQRRFVGVTLALKFIQLPKQASSFVNAFADYKLRQRNRIPGVDFVLDVLGFTFDTAYTLATFRSSYKEAMKSASFRNRIRESFKTADLLGLEVGVGARSRMKKTKLGRFLRKAKVVANSPTLVGDIMGVMGYMSAYRANLRNGMSEQEALEKFNSYNETQQTRRPTEKVGIQRSKSVFARSFTMFGSTFYLQLNKLMQSVTNISRDGFDALKLAKNKEFKNAYKQAPKTKDYRELVLNLSIANFLFTAIANAFKYNPFMDDDDEITEEDMEVIKKAQNALKRGKDISDEEQELLERYQFQLDKNAVIRSYKESLFGLNQLYNMPIVGPSSKMLIDYSYWKDPNAFASDRVRQINPLAELTKDVGRDAVWNDQSIFESAVNPLISFSMGIDVNKPLALLDRVQYLLGDDEMYREGYEELNDKGERKFKGTFEEYKAKQMEENMYDLMGISYSYRPGSGKDWTKKKITITIDPKTEKQKDVDSAEKKKKRAMSLREKKRKRRRRNK